MLHRGGQFLFISYHLLFLFFLLLPSRGRHSSPSDQLSQLSTSFITDALHDATLPDIGWDLNPSFLQMNHLLYHWPITGLLDLLAIVKKLIYKKKKKKTGGKKHYYKPFKMVMFMLITTCPYLCLATKAHTHLFSLMFLQHHRAAIHALKKLPTWTNKKVLL